MKFDYCKTVSTKTATCNKEAFEKLLIDQVVVDHCAKIRQIVDGIPADASKQQMDDAEAQIKKYKQGSDADKIPSLPGFCFHASFSDGRRSNDSAVASGLASIDLDDVEPSPRDFFADLRESAIAEHLALAYISPSTRGLKLVFAVPEGAYDMKSAQEIIVNRLGIEAYYDHNTFDMARLAFVSPMDYVLYRNDDILFGENPLPESWGKDDEAETKKVDAFSGPHTPQEKASEQYIDGICMQDIITRLSEKFCGKPEPEVSHRNNTLYQTAKIMRVYCDDNLDILFKVMPRWGLGDTEWENTIRSACKRAISQTTRYEAESFLMQIRREKAIERGETSWQLPAPPENLPPVFKEYAHVTSEALVPAQLLSLLPILGFYGTMSKANYANPGDEDDWRTPSFITVVVAPTGSGKKHITSTYTRLTEKERIREQAIIAQQNKFNVSKKKEDEPKEAIRLLPERLSMTSMSVQMERAQGQHELIFTPEIDTLKTSNGSGGWADLSTVFRKAIDNDLMGQIYMSGDSHCCNVPIYLNMLIEAQPETVYSFFNKDNIVNGLVSRVFFVELPDNTGCRELKVRKMSDFERKNVDKTIAYLESIRQEISPAEFDDDGNMIKPAVLDRKVLYLPRSRKALKAWGIEHQNHYLQTQENPAEDHFFRRSALLGFHAAMVAYMCCGCKETKTVVDFALWVAEFCLQSQLLYFGKTYNELHKIRTEKRVDQVIAINEVSQFNLLDALPEEFTTQDMQNAMREAGRSLSNPSMKIKKWKQAYLITEIPQQGQIKKWRKM